MHSMRSLPVRVWNSKKGNQKGAQINCPLAHTIPGSVF